MTVDIQAFLRRNNELALAPLLARAQEAKARARAAMETYLIWQRNDPGFSFDLLSDYVDELSRSLIVPVGEEAATLLINPVDRLGYCMLVISEGFSAAYEMAEDTKEIYDENESMLGDYEGHVDGSECSCGNCSYNRLEHDLYPQYLRTIELVTEYLSLMNTLVYRYATALMLDWTAVQDAYQRKQDEHEAQVEQRMREGVIRLNARFTTLAGGGGDGTVQ